MNDFNLILSDFCFWKRSETKGKPTLQGMNIPTLALSLCVVATIVAGDSSCRFAPLFHGDDVFANATVRETFLLAHAKMESYFMKYIGLDQSTSLTHDGHRLSIESGLPYKKPHMFSAPSKESVHVAVLAKVLDKSSAIANATYTIADALEVLEKKVTSMEKFSAQFPGFGGFFPWVSYDGEGGVSPAWDWQNRVPSLDNGELFWAAFAVSNILNRSEYVLAKPGLGARWTNIWRSMVKNAKAVFYDGNGNFRTVTNLKNQSLPVENNTYTGQPSYLDDPYEGELFTDFVFLFCDDLNETEKELIWVNKRAMLQKVDLPVTILDNVTNATHVENITVQRGFWFSAHEQWKYLMLPYTMSETNRRVFLNGERARTWYAHQYRKAPGLWASVNGPIPTDNSSFPYYSDCGIPPIAFQTVLHDDVITPYGAMSLILANQAVGVEWLHRMITYRKGQNCYGTTESFNVTGTTISPLTTWDSKITTLAATVGGIADINAGILKDMGLLGKLVGKIESEWSRVFALPLSGELLGFKRPEATLPALIPDFTSCSATSPACSYP